MFRRKIGGKKAARDFGFGVDARVELDWHWWCIRGQLRFFPVSKYLAEVSCRMHSYSHPDRCIVMGRRWQREIGEERGSEDHE